MKKLFLLSIISSFIFIQSCNTKSETYEGEWVTKDIDYAFDLECDCTAEQRAQFEPIIAETMDGNIQRMGANTSLSFLNSKSVSGKLLYNEVHGTYKTVDKQLIVDIEEYGSEEVFDIEGEGDDALFIKKATQDELKDMTQTIEIPDAGELQIMFTKLKIILEKQK